MKVDIHPEYTKEAVFTCACGASYKMGSVKKTVNVEICSNCHPFYTGQEKVLDTAGRVEKFKARAASAKNSPKTTSEKVKTEKKTEKNKSAK